MASPSLSPDYLASGTPRKAWRKLLWVKQDYPDNHVDSTFLHELQRNVNVRTYDYWAMVFESGTITQHISSVVIFIAIFIYMQRQLVSATMLIWAGPVATGTINVLWDVAHGRIELFSTAGKQVIKSTLFFLWTLLGLTPILKTLTSPTSDDTIWALTFCCFLTNILFHDYVFKRQAKIPGSLSTNAAIFASVLLASRFDTNREVFGLLSFAIEWFAVFPILRRNLRHASATAQIALTLIMLLLCVALFSQISKAVVIIYLIGFCFITFVCPYWLISIQKYKNEIHGPWDEARPRLQRPRKHIRRLHTAT